jgi:hypothetical protein
MHALKGKWKTHSIITIEEYLEASREPAKAALSEHPYTKTQKRWKALTNQGANAEKNFEAVTQNLVDGDAVFWIFNDTSNRVLKGTVRGPAYKDDLRPITRFDYTVQFANDTIPDEDEMTDPLTKWPEANVWTAKGPTDKLMRVDWSDNSFELLTAAKVIWKQIDETVEDQHQVQFPLKQSKPKDREVPHDRFKWSMMPEHRSPVHEMFFGRPAIQNWLCAHPYENPHRLLRHAVFAGGNYEQHGDFMWESQLHQFAPLGNAADHYYKYMGTKLAKERGDTMDKPTWTAGDEFFSIRQEFKQDGVTTIAADPSVIIPTDIVYGTLVNPYHADPKRWVVQWSHQNLDGKGDDGNPTCDEARLYKVEFTTVQDMLCRIEGLVNYGHKFECPTRDSVPFLERMGTGTESAEQRKVGEITLRHKPTKMTTEDFNKMSQISKSSGESYITASQLKKWMKPRMHYVKHHHHPQYQPNDALQKGMKSRGMTAEELEKMLVPLEQTKHSVPIQPLEHVPTESPSAMTKTYNALKSEAMYKYMKLTSVEKWRVLWGSQRCSGRIYDAARRSEQPCPNLATHACGGCYEEGNGREQSGFCAMHIDNTFTNATNVPRMVKHPAHAVRPKYLIETMALNEPLPNYRPPILQDTWAREAKLRIFKVEIPEWIKSKPTGAEAKFPVTIRPQFPSDVGNPTAVTQRCIHRNSPWECGECGQYYNADKAYTAKKEWMLDREWKLRDTEKLCEPPTNEQSGTGMFNRKWPLFPEEEYCENIPESRLRFSVIIDKFDELYPSIRFDPFTATEVYEDLIQEEYLEWKRTWEGGYRLKIYQSNDAWKKQGSRLQPPRFKQDAYTAALKKHLPPQSRDVAFDFKWDRAEEDKYHMLFNRVDSDW